MPVGSLEKQIKDINKPLSATEDILSLFYIARGIVIKASFSEPSIPVHFLSVWLAFFSQIFMQLSLLEMINLKSSHNLLQNNADIRLFAGDENTECKNNIDLTYYCKYARYLSISRFINLQKINY